MEGMDRTIKMEKHHVEAWGLWWVEWQKITKERLQKHGMSPKAFVDQHLVTSEEESFGGNTAGGGRTLALLPK